MLSTFHVSLQKMQNRPNKIKVIYVETTCTIFSFDYTQKKCLIFHKQKFIAFITKSFQRHRTQTLTIQIIV